jgi:hemoglobin
MELKNLAKFLGWTLVAFLFLSAGGANLTAQMAGSGKGESLYKRLGGYDAIAAVTDDFINRVVEDKQLARFFVGLSTDSKKKLRQHAVEQLCEATGGSCVYVGRTMKASHAGLGITESDWQVAVKHLVASLDKFKVPELEKGGLLAIASSLKADIVEKKQSRRFSRAKRLYDRPQLRVRERHPPALRNLR